MKPLNGGFQLKQPAALPAMDRNHQKLSGFSRNKTPVSGTNMSATQGRASRTMGQLKMARNLSYAAAGMPSSEGQRQYAANAFDQQKTQGGELAAPVGGGPQVVVPPGTGAPDTVAPQPIPDVPTDVPAVPSYDQQNQQAKELAKLAEMLKKLGDMLTMIGGILMAVGAVLMAIGMKLISNPLTMPMGVALLAAGVAMMAMGGMMLAMGMMAKQAAEQMAQQAQQTGQQMQNEGQTTQGQIAADNAQAKANGAAYTPPDMSSKLQNNADLQQRIETERNSTYSFDNVDTGKSKVSSVHGSGI